MPDANAQQNPGVSAPVVLLNFTRPTRWWGWCIAYYQLLRGCKYWQFTHVNILTEVGAYAYNLDGEYIAYQLAFPDDFGTCIASPSQVADAVIKARALGFVRRHGHFSPLGLLRGVHCTSFVLHCLRLRLPRSVRLPAHLYEHLH